ncbi:MAG: hypothetical protein WCK02_03030 [Bacteroidota bacterium]
MKDHCVGLIFDCPYGKKMENCPFNAIRELEFKERFEAFKNLSDEEITKLYKFHKNCCLYQKYSAI